MKAFQGWLSGKYFKFLTSRNPPKKASYRAILLFCLERWKISIPDLKGISYKLACDRKQQHRNKVP